MLSPFTVAKCPLTALPVRIVRAVSRERNKNWLEVNAKSFGFKCLQSAGMGAGLATAGRVLVGTPVF